MDHEGDGPPPFWFQPPATALLRRQRRRSSSLTFTPVALIILVPILALLLISLLLIPIVSKASQFLKTPNSIKKGWDSLNILLVLFAIVCGVLLRQNHDDDDASVANAVDETINNNPVSTENGTSEWVDDDQKININRLRGGGGRMMRSSSSYPDLRQEQEESIMWHRPYRFYDDFDLNIHHSLPLQYSQPSQADDDSDIKVIPVDTFVSRSPPPPPPPPPVTLSAAPPMSSESLPEQQAAPQQQQPPKEDQPPQQQEEAPQQQQPKEDEEAPLQQPRPRPVKLKRRRSVRNSTNKESIKRRSEIYHLHKIDSRSLPSSPPPPAAAPPNPPSPPPPPPPPVARHQEKSEMLERKKSGATKEIATAIASLYYRTKKKKQHKIRNIYDHSTTTSSPPPTKSSITPPPPPPPPPSVFHNMFKKGNKSKKIHSISQPPPPPPPPPPNSIFNNIFKNSSKSKRFNSISIPPPPPPLPQSSILNHLFKAGTTSKRFIPTSVPPQPQSRRQKPPLPTKTSNYYEYTGSQSPVVPIPPPPPPPPFKMRQVKFEARGDFVRIKSGHGSRSSSPELEDIEVASTSETQTPRAVDGGGKAGGSSVFCPSPDVNTKADNFIARLRDEWRLEKMNSIKAKQ